MTEHDRFMTAEENFPYTQTVTEGAGKHKSGETQTGAHARNYMRKQVPVDYDTVKFTIIFRQICWSYKLMHLKY